MRYGNNCLRRKGPYALRTYPFSERYGWLEDKYGVSWQVIFVAAGAAPQKFTPVLMFVGNVCGKAEEAIEFYVSVFGNAPDGAKTGETKRRSRALRQERGTRQGGTVRYAHFWLLGQEFGAMDSARDHKFAFNGAISFIVPCESQEEIDYFWGQLSADPKAEQCGWLKDKYGVSWQITPAIMNELLSGNDKKRVERVTQAFLQMKKFDIGALKRAAAG